MVRDAAIWAITMVAKKARIMMAAIARPALTPKAAGHGIAGANRRGSPHGNDLSGIGEKERDGAVENQDCGEKE